LGLLEKMGEGFAKAMDDDFNSREAVAKVLGMVREITKVLSNEMEAADRNAFAHYAVELLEETGARVLGVLPSQEVALAEPEEHPRKAEIADQVEALLVERAEAREAKDWAVADRIRDELQALGVVVTDTATGPEWDLA
jgi:cysteinyl-tRNA synthetase